MEDKVYIASCKGFSATVEACAVDQNTGYLWLLSLVGSQSNLKSIFANLVKKHPTGVRIMEQDDPLATLDKSYYYPDPVSAGTWHMRYKKLPCGKYHGLLFTLSLIHI